jgi:hypothetical protein
MLQEVEERRAKGISSSSKVPAAAKGISRRDSPSLLTPREAVRVEKTEPRELKERFQTLIGRVMLRADFSCLTGVPMVSDAASVMQKPRTQLKKGLRLGIQPPPRLRESRFLENPGKRMTVDLTFQSGRRRLFLCLPRDPLWSIVKQKQGSPLPRRRRLPGIPDCKGFRRRWLLSFKRPQSLALTISR